MGLGHTSLAGALRLGGVYDSSIWSLGSYLKASFLILILMVIRIMAQAEESERQQGLSSVG